MRPQIRSGGVPTIFTRIIDGELPGQFVWSDDRCVVFLSINPVTPGHALVVPRAEIDHWLDLDPELAAHLMVVAHTRSGWRRCEHSTRRGSGS